MTEPQYQPDVVNGVPLCTEESCRCFDGKRCELLGRRPGNVCEPAVIALSLKVAKMEQASIRQVANATPIHTAALKVVEVLGETEGNEIRMPTHLALALLNLWNTVKREGAFEEKVTDTLARKCDELQAENDELKRRVGS